MTKEKKGAAPKRVQRYGACDHYDVAILSALVDEPRQSAVDIGRKVHLSRTAVTRRIAALVDRKVFVASSQLVDFGEIGYEVRALVELLPHANNLDVLCRQLNEFPEVLEYSVVSGSRMLLIDVIAGNVRHLRWFLKRLQRYGKSATSIVFERCESRISLADRLRLLDDRIAESVMDD